MPVAAAGRPRVAFVTLGCPKNEVDSDRMAASLASSFELVADLDQADAVVVNTCAFIQEATEESIAVVLDVAGEWKSADASRVLVVTGCMPSRYGEGLAESLPEVDAFVPVTGEEALADVLARLTGTSAAPSGVHTASTRLVPGPSAYLQVSDGCHRACTYCIIPTIRGPYRSRAASEIVAEARSLVAAGAKELVLIGQDISSWGHDLADRPVLADLIRELASVPGLSWLRLMYVQPDEITPELLDAMTSSPKVCRYLDMPLQHASKDVLRRMGRRGDAAEYLRLIGVIRDLLPGVTLRTTLIAGFPGETREDSRKLLDFVKKSKLDYVGVFPYSQEEGTVAAEMPDQVPRRTRVARAQRIRDAADEIGFARVAGLIGETLEVLVEGVDEDGTTFGRHRGQAPEIDGLVFLDAAAAPGTIVTARIVDTMGYDLVGEVE
jgi:ribosomal protein S12 methylthiotransferase